MTEQLSVRYYKAGRGGEQEECWFDVDGHIAQVCSLLRTEDDPELKECNPTAAVTIYLLMLAGF